jgi:hypothetical protein
LSGSKSGDCRLRDAAEARGDLRSGPAAPGFAEKGVASDIEERLRKGVGDEGIGGVVKGESRDGLRERFDQSDAEGPDIGSGARGIGGRGGGFGSVVKVGFALCFGRLADRKNGVARKLELIADSEKIRRLDVSVGKRFGVEIDEHIDDGIEHVAGFFRSEGALGKKLSEIFLGTFHNDVEELHVLDAAASGVEKSQKIRMRKLGDLRPNGELLFGGGTIGGDEFDGGLARLRVSDLREENGAVIGGREKMVERKPVVGELTFPSFPYIAHDAPLPWDQAKQRITAASVAGLGTATTTAGARGRALDGSILARNGRE